MEYAAVRYKFIGGLHLLGTVTQADILPIHWQLVANNQLSVNLSFSPKGTYSSFEFVTSPLCLEGEVSGASECRVYERD